MASHEEQGHHTRRDAFGEAGGWRDALGSALSSVGSWKLIRRLDSPHLYYPSAYVYETREPFTSVDGMERIKRENTKPYECTINPDDGRFERLLVQAPKDICSTANGTWNRTVIRNVSPLYLRMANLPFKGIHRSRRSNMNTAEYDQSEWIIIVCLWPVAAVGILFYALISALETSQPLSKDVHSYLPFHYKGYKYPLLAKNHMENRDVAALERLYDPRWLSSGVSYRPLRPRYLCFLRTNGFGFDVRPVRADQDVSYVFIAYTTEHFNCAPGRGNVASADLKTLSALALMVTRQCKKKAEERKERAPDAFWLAHLCTPHDRFADDDGNETMIDQTNEHLVQKLKNEDTYSISDVIRMAERVVVMAGNPSSSTHADGLTRKQANDKAIKEWGSRAWTLPEILLSRGHSVTVCYTPQKPLQLQSVPKQFFPTLVWSDGPVSRQLVDHFSTLPLSRLELVNVAWECLTRRGVGMRKRFAGDLSYILMGILRLRPPVDTTDSPFQAFGRLSLPQDGDRLMERLILLLPRQGGPQGDRPWEEMTDQFSARLWDIYPDIQICGIGEADTVVVDGFKGALIQWDQLHPVRTARRLTLKRRLIMAASKYSLPLFLVGIGLTFLPGAKSGGIFLVLLSLVFPLLAPILIPHLYSGKLWGVEPCLFGIEGYVPLAEIERRLFGTRLRGERLRWSPNFSPLSRHGPTPAGRERSQSYYDNEGLLLADPVEGWRDTDLVEGKDPLLCGRCEAAGGPGVCPAGSHPTYEEVRRQGHGQVGGLKTFTLIDTLSMTVTLFEARRPPIALLVGGSEGGMKRALACSYDMATGVLHRETVLRIPTTSVDHMHSVARVRLGLQRRFHDVKLRPRERDGPAPPPPPGPALNHAPARSMPPTAPVATQTKSNARLQTGAAVRANAPWHPQSLSQRQQQHRPYAPTDAGRPLPELQTSSLAARRPPPGTQQAIPEFPVMSMSTSHPVSRHPGALPHQDTEPSPQPIVREAEAEQMHREPSYFDVSAQPSRQQDPSPGRQIRQQQHSPSGPLSVDSSTSAHVDPSVLARPNVRRPAPRRIQATMTPSGPSMSEFSTISSAMEMQPLIQRQPTGPNPAYPQQQVSGSNTHINPQQPQQYEHHIHRQQQHWDPFQQQQQLGQQFQQPQQHWQGPPSSYFLPPDPSPSNALKCHEAPAAYAHIQSTGPTEEEEPRRRNVLHKRPPSPPGGTATAATNSSVHGSVRSGGGSASITSGTVMASDAGGGGRELSLSSPWENASLGSAGGTSEWTVAESHDSSVQGGGIGGRRKLVKKKGPVPGGAGDN